MGEGKSSGGRRQGVQESVRGDGQKERVRGQEEGSGEARERGQGEGWW